MKSNIVGHLDSKQESSHRSLSWSSLIKMGLKSSVKKGRKIMFINKTSFHLSALRAGGIFSDRCANPWTVVWGLWWNSSYFFLAVVSPILGFLHFCGFCIFTLSLIRQQTFGDYCKYMLITSEVFQHRKLTDEKDLRSY